MEKFTVQTFSDCGSFANPEGDDVYFASTWIQVDAILRDWMQTHRMTGSDEYDAFLFVWERVLNDVTDAYPDYLVRLDSVTETMNIQKV